MWLLNAPMGFVLSIWHLSWEWRWEATWFCNIIKPIKGAGGNLIQFWLKHDHEYERLHKCSSHDMEDEIIFLLIIMCSVILFYWLQPVEYLIIFSLIDELNLTSSYGGYGHLWSLHGHERLQTYHLGEKIQLSLLKGSLSFSLIQTKLLLGWLAIASK